jgi:O-methyltransferase/aklanonic acid methyltransferase
MSDDPTDRKAEAKMRFNAAAADYDAGPGVFAHFGRRLVAAAEIAPGNRVLDVACGRGAALFPAAQQAGESGDVIGVDFAEEMVRATTDEVVRLSVRARLQVMDAEHLQFPDASFDRVLCGFSIMFFPTRHRLSPSSLGS